MEQQLLAGLPEPVLDVGCGPGRLVAELTSTGRTALGIDPSPAAVAESTARGAPALRRSVFGPLPGEGRWGSVLLVDGNIGIGGDPSVLLRRVRDLLAPGGIVVAEVEPPGQTTRTLQVRLHAIGTEVGPETEAGPTGRSDPAGADVNPTAPTEPTEPEAGPIGRSDLAGPNVHPTAPTEPEAGPTGPTEPTGPTGPWFPWATVAADDVASLALRAGLALVALETLDGRWFASAHRP